MRNNLSHILSHFWGFVPLKCISACIKKNVFEIIYQNKEYSLEDIARSTGWLIRPTSKVVNLLVELNLLSVNTKELYSITPLCQKWFIRNSENYLGDFALRAEKLMNAYNDLDAVLVSDNPSKSMEIDTHDAFGRDKYTTQSFVSSMHSMSLEIASKIVEKLPVSKKSKILDIGSGIGTISRKLLDYYPDLSLYLVDLPGVTDFTKKHFSEYNKTQNINIITSDWRELTEIVDVKFDCIILSQILHEEKEIDSKQLLKLSSDLLNNNGYLIVIGFFGNTEEQYLLQKIFTLNMMVELGADNPDHQLISRWCNNIGIIETDCYYAAGGRSVWVGQKSK